MKLLSKIYDGRVNCDNLLLEMSISEYLSVAEAALGHNEFQRRRVKGSKTVYALLKEDLLKECVIPPLVLSIAEQAPADIAPFLEMHKNHLLILDGLQRTYTIIDVRNELMAINDEPALAKLLSLPLRIELYCGINRIGVLYRMLTLNTGQTPMSLRQQIEMLYVDFTDVADTGLTLIREVDGIAITDSKQYNFKEIVEGFSSFLERDELPFDRTDLLENIKGLDNLSKETGNLDVFKEFLLTTHAFVDKANSIVGNGHLSDEYKDKNGTPWGDNALEIFKRPQCLTGFGAALGRLKDVNSFTTFQEAREIISEIQLTGSPESFLELMNDKMIDIRKRSKKIGNSQRLFFAYYFRELLNSEAVNYLSLDGAIEPSYRKFESQTF